MQLKANYSVVLPALFEQHVLYKNNTFYRNVTLVNCFHSYDLSHEEISKYLNKAFGNFAGKAYLYFKFIDEDGELIKPPINNQSKLPHREVKQDYWAMTTIIALEKACLVSKDNVSGFSVRIVPVENGNTMFGQTQTFFFI